jgi:hypothetical protein
LDVFEFFENQRQLKRQSNSWNRFGKEVFKVNLVSQPDRNGAELGHDPIDLSTGGNDSGVAAIARNVIR